MSSEKWGGSLGNGVGLLVTEMTADDSTTFRMHPDLYHESYLPTMLVGARDIEDETLGGIRYTSFVSERNGFISLVAREEQS